MHRIIFIVLAILSGCEKSSSNSPSSANPASSPSPTIRIIYIPKNSGNPYFDRMIDGFRKAAQET